MQVFLSYGHDHNRWLVEAIRNDLKVAGYDHVWFDNERITPTDDWRRAILDGLRGSEWVLGFLSRHSVRDPGVCLDELGIALHHKGGQIATVLLEGEADAPVSVSHIQWLDMSDWAAKRAEGEAAWGAWYRPKLAEILKILASPANRRFAGEIEALKRLLRPISQQARAGALIDGFVGREWLLKHLDAWRRASLRSRLLWISGAAGTGKSAFAAWLAHFGRVNVVGLNLCEYNKDDLHDAGRVIRTLAFQVATRLPDYRRFLLDRFESLDPAGEELARRSPASAFSWLLSEPLRVAIDGGRRADRSLIVIDGLDETVRDGRSELAEVLAEQAGILPEWLALVVTGRPEESIRRQFDAFNPVEIEAQSPENLADLRDYLSRWLAAAPEAGADPREVVERVVRASGGNFLYVRMLREAVERGTMGLDAPEGLPKGLAGLYERWFRHRFPRAADYEVLRPVIAVLVAARTPVPEPWLARMFGWSVVDRARVPERLGSLFEERGGGLAPFHKSLRDWLVEPRAAGAAFVVDEAAGRRTLLDALWPAHVACTEDAFCVAELPALVAQASPEDLRARLAAVANAPSFLPALCSVAAAQAGAYAWERAIAWWGLVERLAEADDEPSFQAYAHMEAGDVALTLGRSGAAIESYRNGLAIAERLAAANPSDARWQRDLSVYYERVGDVQVAQGDRAGALRSYRDSLAIRERLAPADPANAGWQRDLSISLDRIGNVQMAQGDRAEALRSYRDGLAIAERLAAADPANARWQRDLSVNFTKVGNAQMAQGDRAEALRSYRDGLAIVERLAATDPANAGWQRDLFVCFTKVGDVQVAQGDRAGALRSYRDGLAIVERLAATDPANAGWQRDLSVSFNNVGDVQVAQGDRHGALRSYRDGLAIAERLAAADPANARWQRDLSVSFTKVGDVQVAQGDRDGALRSYRDGLAVRERLAAADPANAGLQRDLSISFDRVGDVQMAQGDLARALESYRDGLTIVMWLAAADPDNADWQRDLSVSYDHFGNVQVAQGDRAGALESYRDGLAIRQRLAAADPGNADWQRGIIVSCVKIAGSFPAEARAMLTRALAIAVRLRDTGRLAPVDAWMPDDLAERLSRLP